MGSTQRGMGALLPKRLREHYHLDGSARCMAPG
jgi:hypothetical protein